MTESSADKSTRLFVKQLSNPIWCYQISIFYERYSDTERAISDKAIITDQLARCYPEQPFLYRLCLNSSASTDVFEDLKKDDSFGKTVVAPYHTVFSSRVTEIKELQKRLSVRLVCEVRLKRRVFSGIDKYRYIASLRVGEPHDLKNYFKSGSPIKRTAIIGKRFITS